VIISSVQSKEALVAHVMELAKLAPTFFVAFQPLHATPLAGVTGDLMLASTARRRSRSRLSSGSVGADLLPRWPRIIASDRVTGGSLGFCGFLRGFFGFSRLPTIFLVFFIPEITMSTLPKWERER